MTTFAELGIKNQKYQGFFQETGIRFPSDVQKAAISPMLSEKSVVCIAQTGTGKTLAYALPAVERLKRWEAKHGKPYRETASPYALIVVPSRELVTQVARHFKELAHHMKVRVRVLQGGFDKKRSQDTKSQVMDILVATPLKVMKSLEKGELSFKRLQLLILDEGDQLFEGGFAPDIHQIIKKTHYPEVEIGFFSATYPSRIRNQVKGIMDRLDPVELNLPGAHTLARKIKTKNILLTPGQKIKSLLAFLQSAPSGQGIIFLTSRDDADILFEHVDHHLPRLKKVLLHGDLDGPTRQRAYKSFNDGRSQVLIASDLAARGLDLPDVEWVVNFDLPTTTAFYIHRCGRTGRMGKQGLVYNFITYQDKRRILAINRAVSQESSLRLSALPEVKKAEQDLEDVRRQNAAAAASTSARRGKGRFITEEENRLKRKKFFERTRSKTSGRKKKRR